MSEARLAWTIFAAAFLVRLVAWMGSAMFGTDACHFLLMADWLREGRFSEALAIGYHPLYPLLIGVASVPFGHTAAAGGLISVALGAAAVLPLFHLIRSLLGRPEAYVASLLYAFNPSIVELNADVMTEGVFTFFFLLAMALTWRQLQQPSLAGAIALGAAAAAAYLTRPEGLLAFVLAVAWPAVAAIARPGKQGALAVGALATAAVALVLVFPYLAWVRSVRGHWSLSARPSVGSAAAAVGTLLEAAPTGGGSWSAKLVDFLKAVYRLTYLVMIPAYLLGFAALIRKKAVPVLFLLSFPLGYLGGLLFSLRVHTFMSYRYVIPPMAVLMGVAALGLTDVLRRVATARPGSPRLAVAAAGVLLALGVLPGLRALVPTRWECRSYADAARWIESKGRPRALSGPLQQVAYLAGCRSYYSEVTRDGIDAQIARDHVDYYVYSERDVQKRPDYVALLRSSPALEAPVEITGPPGTLKVYIHRVR